ncbi:hypothetical protein H0H81_000361 [Sphagnurus paluster]|uniref:Uncharacterized protein n=1 Tax=Sphagnurus paluster TaxID=117069 RepID=A0A9P7KIX7_9AGAR|nr:hypothetical protein H0H81_000361 [Sphagnurus paluster]
MKFKKLLSSLFRRNRGKPKTSTEPAVSVQAGVESVKSQTDDPVVPPSSDGSSSTPAGTTSFEASSGFPAEQIAITTSDAVDIGTTGSTTSTPLGDLLSVEGGQNTMSTSSPQSLDASEMTDVSPSRAVIHLGAPSNEPAALTSMVVESLAPAVLGADTTQFADALGVETAGIVESTVASDSLVTIVPATPVNLLAPSSERIAVPIGILMAEAVVSGGSPASPGIRTAEAADPGDVSLFATEPGAGGAKAAQGPPTPELTSSDMFVESVDSTSAAASDAPANVEAELGLGNMPLVEAGPTTDAVESGSQLLQGASVTYSAVKVGVGLLKSVSPALAPLESVAGALNFIVEHHEQWLKKRGDVERIAARLGKLKNIFLGDTSDTVNDIHAELFLKKLKMVDLRLQDLISKHGFSAYINTSKDADDLLGMIEDIHDMIIEYQAEIQKSINLKSGDLMAAEPSRTCLLREMLAILLNIMTAAFEALVLIFLTLSSNGYQILQQS